LGKEKNLGRKGGCRQRNTFEKEQRVHAFFVREQNFFCFFSGSFDLLLFNHQAMIREKPTATELGKEPREFIVQPPQENVGIRGTCKEKYPPGAIRD